MAVLKAWGFNPAKTLLSNLCWILQHHHTSFSVHNSFLIEILENFGKKNTANTACDSPPIDQLNCTRLQSLLGCNPLGELNFNRLLGLFSVCHVQTACNLIGTHWEGRKDDGCATVGGERLFLILIWQTSYQPSWMTRFLLPLSQRWADFQTHYLKKA